MGSGPAGWLGFFFVDSWDKPIKLIAMDNSRILRGYVSPVRQMIKRSLTPLELNNFEKRLNEFYNSNVDNDSESFKKKVRSEFEMEVEIARHHNIEFMTNVIMKNVLFFFWVTISTLVITLIATIGILGDN